MNKVKNKFFTMHKKACANGGKYENCSIGWWIKFGEGCIY